MSEPALKCGYNAILSKTKLFNCLLLKIVSSCCFSLGGNLDFSEFLQKKLYNNYWDKDFLGKSDA